MVEHFIKDLRLALAYADDRELALPGADVAFTLYDMLDAIGGAKAGHPGHHGPLQEEADAIAAGLTGRSIVPRSTVLTRKRCGCGEHGDDYECGCGHYHVPQQRLWLPSRRDRSRHGGGHTAAVVAGCTEPASMILHQFRPAAMAYRLLLPGRTAYSLNMSSIP